RFVHLAVHGVIAAALAFLCTSARAAEDDWKLDLEGYYRVRGYAFPDLYENQKTIGKYIQQRLRIQPQIDYKDEAKLFVMADMLDDVVWGDNESVASTALFAGDPTATDITGTESSAFALKRV